MKWQIVDSGIKSAQTIMDYDSYLLNQLSCHSRPILHFYEWEKPSLTYGYFIKPEQFLNLSNIKKNNIQIAKRPTGGGIIFHLTDFAFSILVPSSHSHFSENTLENYHFVNRHIANALSFLMGDSFSFYKDMHTQNSKNFFCMAKPTQYDLMINEKKVGGAAQRKTKRGLLHQATLSLSLPPNNLLSAVLINGDEILKLMHQYTYLMLPQNCSFEELEDAKKQIKTKITQYFFHL